ncbi:hypothetical protein RUND412_011323 [Rhizina undulata]
MTPESKRLTEAKKIYLSIEANPHSEGEVLRLGGREQTKRSTKALATWQRQQDRKAQEVLGSAAKMAAGYWVYKNNIEAFLTQQCSLDEEGLKVSNWVTNYISLVKGKKKEADPPTPLNTNIARQPKPLASQNLGIESPFDPFYSRTFQTGQDGVSLEV